eukprot:gene8213-16887_t
MLFPFFIQAFVSVHLKSFKRISSTSNQSIIGLGTRRYAGTGDHSKDIELESQFPTLRKLVVNGDVPKVVDIECIRDRQLDNPTINILLVDSVKCKHGFPQAFIQRPVSISESKVNSGMIRLSCPHLVKAIDQWEAEGGIEEANENLKHDVALRENFLEVNRQWGVIRREAMTTVDAAFVEEYLGQDSAVKLITSGLIGITPDKVDDVKCLHAQVADTLLRGRGSEGNAIGARALDILEQQRGVDPRGCDGCKQQCDVSVPKGEAEWWYMPGKNKARLTATRERRREHRQFIRAKAQRLQLLEGKDAHADAERRLLKGAGANMIWIGAFTLTDKNLI